MSTTRFTAPVSDVSSLYLDALAQTHLLVAGKTGSGKSVVINGMIHAALHSLPGDQAGGVQFIFLDAKGVELSMYRDLPHTLKFAYTPEETLSALQMALGIAKQRYEIMARHGVRKFTQVPGMGGDVYVVIDEFADLMTTQGRAVKPLIQRLAQIGRAANVHIVLATQTPISKVLPTEIKCNFDSRIGLRTRSTQDSRNIFDYSGRETVHCENLATGTAYYMTPEYTPPLFCKVPMVSEDEINRIIAFWEAQWKPARRSAPVKRGFFGRLGMA